MQHHAIETSPENNYKKITMTTGQTNKLAKAAVGPSHPADREISKRHCPRPAARLSRLLEGDHGGSENFLGSQQGKVSFWHDPAHVLVGIFASRQPKPFGAFLTQFRPRNFFSLSVP
jgi:hypothetical protein